MLLQYRGKKKRLHLSMPWLTKEYQFKGGVPVEVAKKDVERLMKDNPRIFGRIEVQEKAEEVVLEDKVEMPPEGKVAGPMVLGAEALGKLPKYPSQMNKEQLVTYAKAKHEVDLDMEKTRMELYDEVAKMDAKLNKA